MNTVQSVTSAAIDTAAARQPHVLRRTMSAGELLLPVCRRLLAAASLSFCSHLSGGLRPRRSARHAGAASPRRSPSASPSGTSISGRFEAVALGRGARPRLRLHRRAAFPGWPDRQGGRSCCSSSTSGPTRSPSSRPRPTSRATRRRSSSPSCEVERGDAAGQHPAPSPSAEFDTRKPTSTAPPAQLKAAEAALQAGRAQSRMDRGARADRRPHLRPPVDAGNLITGGQTGRDAADHHRVARSDPLRVRRLRGGLSALPAPAAAGRAALVARRAESRCAVRLADETDWTRTGKMDFVDNALNPRSGTIRGRAIFDNKDRLLTPGIFGRLRLFGGEHDALLIPDARHRLRPGEQDRVHGRRRQRGQAKPVELGPIVDGCASCAPGSRPPTASSSTGSPTRWCGRAQKVRAAGGRDQATAKAK